MSTSIPDPSNRSALQAEDGRSLGEVMGDLTRHVSTLLQQEMALAKAELRQSLSQAGKGVGLVAGAAVAGIWFLVFLSVSAWWGIGKYIGNDWSGLIVAAILAAVGKKELDRVRGLQQTTETLGKVPNALKGHEEDNR